ncbi:CinA family protein [Alkalimonas collagenimarina]|uniref:CinA family protein n=1 Tax=Alkalimonas collagenimarina TaxID=400390 RepID=A0ABT9GWU7_9GAMM|nr:CinA family protein [Alkalimonas collagenimarina]MDP4535512.1 CinA family protein [Alkalimonas collagenimarina]
MTALVDTIQLASELGQLLIQQQLTVTTAESCTGGGIAYHLTAVPGSSAYLDRSFITYSNKSKQQLLAVPPQTLQQFGAVSLQTVQEMAAGAAKAASADLAIAVSGIAGPGGGSEHKPVGTVCFGFWLKGVCTSNQLHFDGDRTEIRQQSINFALQQSIRLLTASAN